MKFSVVFMTVLVLALAVNAQLDEDATPKDCKTVGADDFCYSYGGFLGHYMRNLDKVSKFYICEMDNYTYDCRQLCSYRNSNFKYNFHAGYLSFTTSQCCCGIVQDAE